MSETHRKSVQTEVSLWTCVKAGNFCNKVVEQGFVGLVCVKQIRRRFGRILLATTPNDSEMSFGGNGLNINRKGQRCGVNKKDVFVGILDEWVFSINVIDSIVIMNISQALKYDLWFKEYSYYFSFTLN